MIRLRIFFDITSDLSYPKLSFLKLKKIESLLFLVNYHPAPFERDGLNLSAAFGRTKAKARQCFKR
jgi:hypothetical protein